MIALLTDLIIKRFGLNLIDEETEDSNLTQLRHKVFDSLLEPLESESRPKNLNYSTFKYTGPRLKRWNEVYSVFVEFLGEIIMDVGAASEMLHGLCHSHRPRLRGEQEQKMKPMPSWKVCPFDCIHAASPPYARPSALAPWCITRDGR